MKLILATSAMSLLLATSALAHEVVHDEDGHTHRADCGHTAVEHDGHIDYLHDGHLHNAHGAHADEHVIEISAAHPMDEALVSRAEKHSAKHSADDGHALVPHGDHFDHLHDGHLHYLHGDHVDEHGELKTL